MSVHDAVVEAIRDDQEIVITYYAAKAIARRIATSEKVRESLVKHVHHELSAEFTEEMAEWAVTATLDGFQDGE